MTIYFLRHADAEDFAETDFDRKLTVKGLDQAARMGNFCVARGIKPTTIEMVLVGRDFDAAYVDQLCAKASKLLAVPITWKSIDPELELPSDALSIYP